MLIFRRNLTSAVTGVALPQVAIYHETSWENCFEMYITRNVRARTISCRVKLSYKHPRFKVREGNVAKL